jgi:hypothetical protein
LFMTLLSHYTSFAGLEGIARSKTLWATDFMALNDKTELGYGYVEMHMRGLRTAWEEVLMKLRADGYSPELNFDDAREKIAELHRRSFEGPRGSERLYVFSFAKAATEDQQRIGLLTLWERYTRSEGYCLQFDEDEVRALLRREATSRNYAVLDLVDVHYGVNESRAEYRELHFQLAQQVLGVIQGAKPDLDIQPKYERLWALPTFATRMLHYCARHKDPFFVDEREKRIIAVPAKQAESRLLVGPALRKQIKTMEDGRTYIDLGEDWVPKIEPRRIIAAPRAPREVDRVLGMFERQPIVEFAKFPM